MSILPNPIFNTRTTSNGTKYTQIVNITFIVNNINREFDKNYTELQFLTMIAKNIGVTVKKLSSQSNDFGILAVWGSSFFQQKHIHIKNAFKTIFNKLLLDKVTIQLQIEKEIKERTQKCIKILNAVLGDKKICYSYKQTFICVMRYIYGDLENFEKMIYI